MTARDVSFIDRVRLLWGRRRTARRYGVRFQRAATFRVPQSISLDGRELRLAVPDEYCQRLAFIEVLLDDSYRLRDLAKRARIETIMDVGANVGLFGLAARAAFPTARIHAYEPNPALAAELAHQAKLADVQYFLEAIGRNSGSASLDVDPQHSVLTITRPDQSGPIPQTAFSVALQRLGGHADLVKLDCEGTEWELLEDRESWSAVDWVTMEYHLRPDEDHDAIVRALDRVGFETRYRRPFRNIGLLVASRRGRQRAADKRAD
jgi:FkbM family methyltransferase